MMSYKCGNCGNTDEFYGVGAVSVTIYFDSNGNMVDADEIDYGGADATIEHCRDCDSTNIIMEEEQ